MSRPRTNFPVSSQHSPMWSALTETLWVRNFAKIDECVAARRKFIEETHFNSRFRIA